MDEDVFRLYSKYYDLLYRDKDYAAEAAYVARALRNAMPSARELLEFGSGTGHHGRLLASMGFSIRGVERSKSMVAMANAEAPSSAAHINGRFQCRQGDLRTVMLDCLFDSVISLFHVVSYQTQNADLLATFANASRHLRPGGIFLFDVWHGPAVLRERPSVRVKRIEDEATCLTRIAEPELNVNAGVVTVRYTIFAESKEDGRLTKFCEDHRMRYLFPVEIDLLANQTGFGVERSEEFLTGEAPSEGTWGVMYMLRKRT
jgi:SAM-dependent methyltransferase